MNKNKNLLLWFFLGCLLFSSQDVQAMRVDQCTAQAGRTCEADCVAAGKIPNPGDPVCARWLLSDQQCCVPNATGPGSGAPGFPTGLNYQLLEKIPGTDNLSGSDLPGYVSALYKVALVIVTLSAVLMLSIGGFMYLTSAGNVSAISTAKGIIYDSLIGLVIALFAWLVLYIINPDLVEITLNGLPSVATSGGGAVVPAPSGTGAPGSCGGLSPQAGINCADAAQPLSDLLACIKGKGVTTTVSSIGDSQGFTACKNKTCACPAGRRSCACPPCAHAQTSCHYGGGASKTDAACQKSHAADLSVRGPGGGMDIALAVAIKSAAAACGARVNDETNIPGVAPHIHISTQTNCCTL